MDWHPLIGILVSWLPMLLLIAVVDLLHDATGIKQTRQISGGSHSRDAKTECAAGAHRQGA